MGRGWSSVGHPGHPGLEAGRDHRGHLLTGGGEDGGQGSLSVMQESVRAVGRELVLVSEHVLATTNPLQA
jgi:hypothetical protein